MSRLWIALGFLAIVYASPVRADCAQTDGDAALARLTDPSNTELRPGQQITAVRGSGGMACTIYFVLSERSKVSIEMSPLPLSRDATAFPNVPYDIVDLSKPKSSESAFTWPLGGGNPTDQGLVSDIMLDAGKYALTFPSKKKKIDSRFSNVTILQPEAVRMTIAGVGAENPSGPQPLAYRVGDSFEIRYGAPGDARPVAIQMDAARFISLAVTWDRRFSDPSIANTLRLYLRSDGGTFPTGHAVLPNNVTHRPDGEEIRFSFFVPQGVTQIMPYVSLPFLAKTTPRELWAAKLTGRFQEISATPPPLAARNLEKMLVTSGYRKFLEPLDVASLEDLRSDPVHHEITLQDFNDFKGRESSRSRIDYGAREEIDPEQRSGPVPKYVILLSLNQDGYEFQDTQRQIVQAQGQSVFDMVLSQASITLGISRSEIGIVAPERCVFGLVRGDHLLDTYLGGDCVGGASGAREIPIGHFAGFGAAGSQNLGKIKRNNFASSVESYLNGKFGTANVQYLSRDTDYVEAIIRGLKGYVIKGSPYWEKLMVFFVQQRDERAGVARLRLIADGSLAAGLGAYPPDSKFETNIEDKNGGALNQFVRSFLDDFVKVTVK